jgi:hypothetical protein
VPEVTATITADIAETQLNVSDDPAIERASRVWQRTRRPVASVRLEVAWRGYTAWYRTIRHVLNIGGELVIILGIILVVIGYFTGLAILETIGAILLVIGLILWILGAVGRPVAGRKVWF